MTRKIPFVFICLLLLVSLAGVSMADEAPSYVAYIQGGEAFITDGTDGMVEIIVKDVIPHFHVSEQEIGILVPVELLTNVTYPVNAAMVFSGIDDESTSIVEVSNLSLSDGNSVLTLQVRPLEFYEGERLKLFHSENKGLNVINRAAISFTGIYAEINAALLENGSDMECIRRCQERYPESSSCWKQCIYK